jgi:hypothetical protein
MRRRLDADPVAIETVNGYDALGSARRRSDSRGTARLRSADPAAPPRFELPGLRDPLDVERLAEAYRRHPGLQVAHRPQIRRLCAQPPAPRHATQTSYGA